MAFPPRIEVRPIQEYLTDMTKMAAEIKKAG